MLRQQKDINIWAADLHMVAYTLGGIKSPTLPTALKVWLAVKLRLVQDSMIGNEPAVEDVHWTNCLLGTLLLCMHMHMLMHILDART